MTVTRRTRPLARTFRPWSPGRRGWAASLAAAVCLGAPALAQAQLQPRLPDLVEQPPSRISVVSARVGVSFAYRLAFRSAAVNIGPGDLIVAAHRPSTHVPAMTADQRVDLADPATGALSGQVTFPRVGTLRYRGDATHHHWHFLSFERYELRRASDHRLAAADRKTGFCIGNRFYGGPTGLVHSAELTRRGWELECADGRPNALRFSIGMSVFQGDDYKPVKEGQYLDITRLASGLYVLVHRVNPFRRLHEVSYANDAASVLLAIQRSRPGARPMVRVLAVCPGVDRCAAPAA